MKQNPSPILRQQVCSQQVSSMKKSDEGWNCKACQHTVADLRNLSPVEILDLYRERGGKLCGVIPLEVNVEREPLLRVPIRKVPNMKALLFGVAAFIALLIAPAQDLKAQDRIEDALPPGLGDNTGETASIWGKVVINGGQPVTDGEVHLENETGAIRKASLDSTGRYTLKGVPPGDYFITLHSYLSMEVAHNTSVVAGEIYRLDIEGVLRPVSIPLQQLQVTCTAGVVMPNEPFILAPSIPNITVNVVEEKPKPKKNSLD